MRPESCFVLSSHGLDEAPGIRDVEGLLGGWGVFETILARGTRALFLDRHLDRLEEGLLALGLTAQPANHIRGAAFEALTAAGERQSRLRIISTTGGGEVVSILSVRPFAGYPDQLYREGCTLTLAEFPRNERSPLAGVKSLSYAENHLARSRAEARGHADAIFLTTEGHLAEGTSSNLFWVRDGELFTPAVGMLPGITRQAVLEIADELGIPSTLGSFPLDDLVSADEVFITSSLRGIMPVRALDDRRIGYPGGEITVQLSAQYADLVQHELEEEPVFEG